MLANDIPQLSAPLVLVHGLCGFDRLTAIRRPAADYFPGVREQLATAGNRIYLARVSPTGGVAERAADLRRYIVREIPSGPFHLIGHSLGGLDARLMVSKLGMESRALSLTTIGTPHWGTAFADWGMKWFSRLFIPFLRLARIPHQAFFDLTTDSCRQFNEDVPDVPGVRYFSIAGRAEAPWVGPEWKLPHRIVGRAEGENDGVVSVASATWGEHTEVWPGDHLNLVNWPNRLARKRGVWNERAPDYGRIVRRLANAGF